MDLNEDGILDVCLRWAERGEPDIGIDLPLVVSEMKASRVKIEFIREYEGGIDLVE